MGPHRPLFDRFTEFTADVTLACRTLPYDRQSREIADQLMRAAGASGSNYGESRDAVSDREYVYKLQKCLQELREAMLWIRVARKIGYTNADWVALERECNELTAMSVACVKKAKKRMVEEKQKDDEKKKGKPE